MIRLGAKHNLVKLLREKGEGERGVEGERGGERGEGEKRVREWEGRERERIVAVVSSNYQVTTQVTRVQIPRWI